ncbi:MAG: zinc ribbon domain-containing protein [Dehalococcoidales bacterium]|nr:MAG: zinc ribbon domain-containing protein [Dehalococcoidales bacterium]
MFCAKCGTEMIEGAQFCSSCGQSVGATDTARSSSFCPQCGSTLDSGMTFCGKCGYRLTPSRAQAVAPPVNRAAFVDEMRAGGAVPGRGLRIAGGVLLIICGVITFILGILVAAGGGVLLYYGGGMVLVFGIIATILGLIAIVGGAFACSGKNFGLALAGAICEILSPIFVLWPMFFIAILPLIFIAVSRKAFT